MHNKFDNLTMRERKGWTQTEDEVLKLLIEERGEIKWSTIARIMQQQFSIVGKTGKQCRQRYHNHLKSTISNGDWSYQQDKQLLKLHQQFGNKWSIIAQRIPGRYWFVDKRAQNCVKNHFYSKLRKVVRRLNRLKAEYSSQAPSIISKSLLSRIIEVSESRFKLTTKISEQWVLFSLKLISKLYNYQSNIQQRAKHQQYSIAGTQILQDINYFELNFKKKKINKKDLSEGLYRQRRDSSFKNKKGYKTIKKTQKDKSIFQRNDIHKMESIRTQIDFQKLQKSQKVIVPLEQNDVQLQNESRQGFKNLNLILRQRSDERNTNFKSFDNFCELDSAMKWQDDKIHVLQQESESYGDQYGYLLEP